MKELETLDPRVLSKPSVLNVWNLLALLIALFGIWVAGGQIDWYKAHFEGEPEWSPLFEFIFTLQLQVTSYTLLLSLIFFRMPLNFGFGLRSSWALLGIILFIGGIAYLSLAQFEAALSLLLIPLVSLFLFVVFLHSRPAARHPYPGALSHGEGALFSLRLLKRISVLLLGLVLASLAVVLYFLLVFTAYSGDDLSDLFALTRLVPLVAAFLVTGVMLIVPIWLYLALSTPWYNWVERTFATGIYLRVQDYDTRFSTSLSQLLLGGRSEDSDVTRLSPVGRFLKLLPLWLLYILWMAVVITREFL